MKVKKKLPVKERLINKARRRMKNLDKKICRLMIEHHKVVNALRADIQEQQEILKALGVRK